MKSFFTVKTVIVYCLTLFFLFFEGCNQATQNTNEWQPLFNGQNLDGWVVKAKPEDIAKDFWVVKKDMIMANSLGDSIHDYVWLMTEKEFADFELII